MAYIYMPYSMPFPVPGQNGLKGFLKVLLEHTWHFQITNAACDRLFFYKRCGNYRLTAFGHGTKTSIGGVRMCSFEAH